jgi:WD40 repeat protein
VEPVYTFRAHEGPVLCLAMSPTGESCYSGGMDGTIRCWNIPNSNIDPYDSFGKMCIVSTYSCRLMANTCVCIWVSACANVQILVIVRELVR